MVNYVKKNFEKRMKQRQERFVSETVRMLTTNSNNLTTTPT